MEDLEAEPGRWNLVWTDTMNLLLCGLRCGTAGRNYKVLDDLNRYSGKGELINGSTYEGVLGRRVESGNVV